MMPAVQGPQPVGAQWSNIPTELKTRPQWCWVSLKLWDAVDADGTPKCEKKPLDPKVAGHVDARTNDPSTWGTFEQASTRAIYENGGIGFVVTQSDPYVCVDLDAHGTAEQSAEHREIIAYFTRCGAYVETSTRGKGSHVWMRRASALGPHLIRQPNQLHPVEIYDDKQFLITTGNGSPVISLPELDWQVRSLYEAYKALGGVESSGVLGPAGAYPQGASSVEDEALLERCRAWDKHGKFAALHDDGDITAYRGDASSADLAYWSILTFAARNGSAGDPVSFEQCNRIYQSSRIATHRSGAYPHKARRTAYVWRTFTRAMRDHTAVAAESVAAFVNTTAACPAPSTETARDVTIAEPTDQEREEVAAVVHAAPPGLVGEIADWVLKSAFIPLPNLATLVALSVAAGVVGRSFKTPFDDAIMLQSVYIAPTGGGKEHAKKATNELFRALKPHCSEAMQFVGPSRFKSGQALRRVINKRKCMLSVADEFGEKMAQVWSAKSDKDAWTEELLAMYGGTDDQGTAAADEKNDVIALDRPAFTLLALTNGEAWFGLLDDKRVYTGVLPRMITIDDSTVIADPVRNRADCVPAGLLTRLASVANACVDHEGHTKPVVRTKAASKALDDEMWTFVLDCRRRYAPGSVGHALSTRIAQNALRVATLLAVLDFPNDAFGQVPIVHDVHWQWARNYVDKAYSWQIERYLRGDMGVGESKQDATLEKLLAKVLAMSPAEIERNRLRAGVVTFRYLSNFLRGPEFSGAKQGERAAREAAIKVAVKNELLRPLDAKEKTTLGLKAEAWFILKK